MDYLVKSTFIRSGCLHGYCNLVPGMTISFFSYSDLNEISTSVASDKVKAELKGNATNPTHELIMLSLPAILGQAIDPFAQLMETAFIGRLGK